jgi:NAD(P)-dependent dehydrogenase (short-subunit alcohol dehydrogenase family)
MSEYTEFSRGRLAGKSILVTGAESGLGRAITLRVASDGGQVTAVGLRTDGLKETADLAEKSDGSVTPITSDIRDPDQMEAAVQRAVDEYGKLDAAVANAGGSLAPPASLMDTDLDGWKLTVDTNLTGTFITLRAAARQMMSQGNGGHLLATGSSTAIRPMPYMYSYMAAKAGVHQLVRALAVDLAPHNIRVNTIVPGGSATPPVLAISDYADRNFPTVPMKALVGPEEIAAIVAFALGDETPHMTGTLLKVDSGRTSI